MEYRDSNRAFFSGLWSALSRKELNALSSSPLQASFSFERIKGGR